jgi:hypothetical protein
MSGVSGGAGRLRAEHIPLLAILLAVAGTVGAYVMVGSAPLVGAEDANIFFRYARNLAEGHGVVFNPGGERVEGITILLWFGIQALVYAAAGTANLEVLLTLISILLTAVTLAAVMHVLAGVAYSRPGLWLGMAWLVAMAGLFLWGGLSLMDVGLWAAALAATWSRSSTGGGTPATAVGAALARGGAVDDPPGHTPSSSGNRRGDRFGIWLQPSCSACGRACGCDAGRDHGAGGDGWPTSDTHCPTRTTRRCVLVRTSRSHAP